MSVGQTSIKETLLMNEHRGLLEGPYIHRVDHVCTSERGEHVRGTYVGRGETKSKEARGLEM